MDLDSVTVVLAVLTSVSKYAELLQKAKRWGRNEQYRRLYRQCGHNWWKFIRESGLWSTLMEETALTAGSALLAVNRVATLVRRMDVVDASTSTSTSTSASTSASTSSSTSTATPVEGQTAEQAQALRELEEAQPAAEPVPESSNQAKLRAMVQRFFAHFRNGRVVFAMFLVGAAGLFALVQHRMQQELAVVSRNALAAPEKLPFDLT